MGAPDLLGEEIRKRLNPSFRERRLALREHPQVKTRQSEVSPEEGIEEYTTEEGAKEARLKTL